MERINREGDVRSVYQPRIHVRRIHEMYEHAQATGRPMTVIVDVAIQEYFERRQADGHDAPDDGQGH